MNGKRIPHSVNPGPQVVCRQCELLRCGKDFVRDGKVQPCCTYCRSANELAIKQH